VNDFTTLDGNGAENVSRITAMNKDSLTAKSTQSAKMTAAPPPAGEATQKFFNVFVDFCAQVFIIQGSELF
jgi:hypothetical protein